MSVAPQDSPVPDPSLVQRFAGVGLVSRQPMEGGFNGLHRSLHRGAGVEFASFRRYAPGEDITRVDWRVYGRTDRFYVRESETDSNATCRLVVDASGSMRYGNRTGTKLDAARQIAAVLATLLIRQGDAVGLTVAGGEQAVTIAPRRTPAHAGVICRTLRSMRAAGDTVLTDALLALAGRQKRRSMVLVFSDGFSDPGHLLTCLHGLAHRHHDVTLFRITHRDEEDFPFTGIIRFDDLEGPAQLTLDAGAVGKHYRERALAHTAALERGCRAHGIGFVAAAANGDLAAAIGSFLGQRQSAPRGWP